MKLIGYVHLIRPVNCLMMGFAVIVGAVLVSQSYSDMLLANLVYGFFTGFALTAASMVINDYCDREIDAINEPTRPIPSSLVQPKEALILASVLTTMGLIAAVFTNTANTFCFFTAIVSWMTSVCYATVGKRRGLLGNFLVSACVAVPFIYGSLAATSTVKSNVLVFVCIVFFANTGREVTKGIVDIEGDKLRNIETVAARYGARNAAFTSVFFYSVAVLLSPLPLLLNLVSIWFVPLVIITDVGFATSSLMIIKNCSRGNARKVKQMILLWFLVGLLGFIFGAIL